MNSSEETFILKRNVKRIAMIDNAYSKFVEGELVAPFQSSFENAEIDLYYDIRSFVEEDQYSKKYDLIILGTVFNDNENDFLGRSFIHEMTFKVDNSKVDSISRIRKLLVAIGIKNSRVKGFSNLIKKKIINVPVIILTSVPRHVEDEDCYYMVMNKRDLYQYQEVFNTEKKLLPQLIEEKVSDVGYFIKNRELKMNYLEVN